MTVRVQELRHPEDMAALGNVGVDTDARARDHIAQIVSQVERLFGLGHAYELPAEDTGASSRWYRTDTCPVEAPRQVRS